MGTVIKLRLKEAIILEDARRIKVGVTPINNIRRLAIEMAAKWPKKYIDDNLDDWLYHISKKGIRERCRTYRMKETVEDLCSLLNTNEDFLMNETKL